MRWPRAKTARCASKFDVTTLPNGGEGMPSAGTLGGWNLGVSQYSENQEAAIELVRFLNNYDNQVERAIVTSRPPTMTAVYDDPAVGAEQPFIPLVAAGGRKRAAAPLGGHAAQL
jgi:trehalose/maltose transport system substrate-binding protein